MSCTRSHMPTFEARVSGRMLQLKSWSILRKLRCSPNKAGHLCKAIAVLQNHRIAQ